MKVETVRIRGFRSIEDVILNGIGGLNVIIGKNNSGKSNILFAVSSFFSSLRRGGVIILDPPIGRPVDHFAENRSEPIEVTVLFRLSLAERDDLIQDIVLTAPQVKNAVDGMDPELRLEVTISFVSQPELFAYVKRMALCRAGSVESEADESRRIILEIGDSAATELAKQARRAQVLEVEAAQVGQLAKRASQLFDPDDWEKIREEPALIRRYFLRLGGTSLDIHPLSLSRVEGLVRNAESLSGFREALSSLMSSMREEANLVRTEPIAVRVDSFSGQETSVPPYALRILKTLGEMKVLYLTERREQIGKREAAQLLDLKVRRGGPEKLRSIQETVSALLGVEIDAFRAESNLGERQEAELDVDKFLIEVNGAGIREALRLILDYEFGYPNLLLVEEPEIHLHPALELSMMRYLKEVGKESQVFLTTHSTNFLDTAEMRNVYMASRNGSTKVQLIDWGEAERIIPRELGIRLSSLFMFDRLLFVEGPSDEDVVREWASILGINLGHASVGFIPMGGVRNLAHFATDSVLSFLSRRQVKMWFLLDRDERDEAEVQRLAAQLGNKAQLIVLQKREIENYLLSIPAIIKFIKIKRGGLGEAQVPSVEEVGRKLNDCADRLKDVAIERRLAKFACSPVYPDREAVLSTASETSILDRLRVELERQRNKLSAMEGELGHLLDEQKSFIEANWSARKKDLVPGDLLLDETFKEFGLRFRKERDSARLAALMTKDEVDREIRNLLESVVK